MKFILMILLFLDYCSFFASDKADRTPFVKGNFYISKGDYSSWREEGYNHKKNIYDVVYPFIKEMERLGKEGNYRALADLACNENFDFREKGEKKIISPADKRFQKLREERIEKEHRDFEKDGNRDSGLRYAAVYIQNKHFFEEDFYNKYFNYSIVMYGENDLKRKTFEIKFFNDEPSDKNREILRKFKFKMKYEIGTGRLCAISAYYDTLSDPQGYEVYEPERKLKYY